MINTVIFDFDGVLVDSEIISYEYYRDLVEPTGHKFSMELYAREYCGKTGYGNMKKLIETYHFNFSIEDGLKAEYEDEMKKIKNVKLKKGALELLSYLKENHYNIAIATSSYEVRARSVLKKNNINDYFQVGVFAEDITKSKPDPEVYCKAVERCKVKPQECLVIEDSNNGILAGYRAGCNVVCILDVAIPEEETLKKTIGVMDSFLDVKEYLKHQSE